SAQHTGGVKRNMYLFAIRVFISPLTDSRQCRSSPAWRTYRWPNTFSGLFSANGQRLPRLLSGLSQIFSRPANRCPNQAHGLVYPLIRPGLSVGASRLARQPVPVAL